MAGLEYRGLQIQTVSGEPRTCSRKEPGTDPEELSRMEPEETSGTDCDCSTTAGTLFCPEKRRTNLRYPKNPALFGVFNQPLTAAVLFILVFVFSRNLWREGTLTLTRDHLVVGLSTLDYVCVNPLTLPERASRDAIWTLVRGVTVVSSIVSVCRLQCCLETSEKIC